MFNRIMSAILSLTLLVNPVMAQEEKTEENWDLQGAMVWQPEKKVLKFGELELAVWILPTHGMTAPIGGYLFYRGDVGQLLERMNNAKGRIDEVIKEERYACDVQLKEKDVSCIRQQEELRIKFDAQVKQISGLNSRIDDKDDMIFYWQLGAGAGAVLALSLGLFAISK